MGIRIYLSVEEREAFRKMLEKLDLTQKDIVDHFVARNSEIPDKQDNRITKSWLSSTLHAKKAVNKVDSDRLSILAGILADHIKQQKFDQATIDDILYKLKRFRPSIELSPSEKTPGEIIRPEEMGYVKRIEEEQILKILQGIPQTTLVSGPVQTGVSSLLSRLSNHAVELGIANVHYDPRAEIVPEDLQGKSKFERTTAFVKSLYETIREAWNISTELQNLEIGDLVKWLQRGLSPTAGIPRLLVLDNIQVLGNDVIEDITSLFTRSITNRRAVGGAQIRLVIGMNYAYSPSFHRFWVETSSFAWQPRIGLPWLRSNEVATMQEQVKSTINTSTIYRMLKGQPFLTHAFLVDETFRKNLSEWMDDKSKYNATALRKNKIYRLHSDSIKLSIIGNNGISDMQNGVITTFLQIATQDFEYIRDNDAETFLELSSIIFQNKLTIELYELIAEDLYGLMIKDLTECL
jgi:hypothetical protein